jgi:hypothetical protein
LILSLLAVLPQSVHGTNGEHLKDVVGHPKGRFPLLGLFGSNSACRRM